MLNKRKTAHNASVDKIPPSDDAIKISTINPTVDDEDLDLINFEQEQDTSTPHNDSTPILGHACASVAPILVPYDPPSL